MNTHSTDQAFPGTSDTRTAEEVEQHIRMENALPLLCEAWGESDLPSAFIAHTIAEVRQFIVNEWFGDATDERVDDVLKEIADHDWKEEGDWDAEFEIGGVSFKRVYESNSRAAISQHEADRARQEPVGMGSGESKFIGKACKACGRGEYFLDGNGYNSFPRCDRCNSVPSLQDYIDAAAPTNPAAQERETTLQRFNRHMEADVESPLERLRFFCSLAMTGQDWLDVEPFFTDVEAAQERAEPVAPAVGAERDRLLETFAEWARQVSEQKAVPTGIRKAAAGLYNSASRLSATPPAPAQPATEPSKPEQAEAPSEAERWAAWVAGMVGSYLGFDVDDKRNVAIAGIIKRRLWGLSSATLPPAIAAGDSGAGELNYFDTEQRCRLAFQQEDGYGDPDANPAIYRKFRDGFFAALATKPQAEQEAAKGDSEPDRWCWYHEGDERVAVLSSESEAHGEAQQWINDNCEPGEEHEYLVAPMKSGLDLLPNASHIGQTILEDINETLSDEMGAEEDPLDLTKEDIAGLGELVREFIIREGKVEWWTIDTKREVKHTARAASNSGGVA